MDAGSRRTLLARARAALDTTFHAAGVQATPQAGAWMVVWGAAVSGGWVSLKGGLAGCRFIADAGNEVHKICEEAVDFLNPPADAALAWLALANHGSDRRTRCCRLDALGRERAHDADERSRRSHDDAGSL